MSHMKDLVMTFGTNPHAPAKPTRPAFYGAAELTRNINAELKSMGYRLAHFHETDQEWITLANGQMHRVVKL